MCEIYLYHFSKSSYTKSQSMVKQVKCYSNFHTTAKMISPLPPIIVGWGGSKNIFKIQRRTKLKNDRNPLLRQTNYTCQFEVRTRAHDTPNLRTPAFQTSASTLCCPLIELGKLVIPEHSRPSQ